MINHIKVETIEIKINSFFTKTIILHNLQNNLIKNRKKSINVILYNRGGRVE